MTDHLPHSPRAAARDNRERILDAAKRRPRAARVAASRRFAALVIQAFRASSQHAWLPPVPRSAPG
ncbi:hypothetical protein [Streptomyces tendae]|uniref:hypothetical protein n=1 Tax=Streptomyces tendae TaxID=1932 RepID=UPI00368A1D46